MEVGAGQQEEEKYVVRKGREKGHECVLGMETGGGGHVAHGEMPVYRDIGQQVQWCQLLGWRQAAEQSKVRCGRWVVSGLGRR